MARENIDLVGDDEDIRPAFLREKDDLPVNSEEDDGEENPEDAEARAARLGTPVEDLPPAKAKPKPKTPVKDEPKPTKAKAKADPKPKPQRRPDVQGPDVGEGGDGRKLAKGDNGPHVPGVETGMAGELILNYVKRLEVLEEEAKAVSVDKSEVWAELKGQGLDSKVIKRILAYRKADKDRLDELDSLFDLYMRAMESAGG